MNRLCKLAISLGLVAMSRCYASAATYMSVGDSITEGKFAGNGGYRQFLQNDLAAGGLPYDFVGKEDDGNAANNTGYSNGMADPNHEGYGSFRIDEILNGGTEEGHTAPAIGTTLSTYHPNVILLMIATNDVLQNHDLDNAPSRLDALVGAIFASDHSAKLILASITPLSNASQDAAAVSYNSAIPGIVSKYVGLGDDAVFVDMHSALNTTSDLSDGIHPTSAGFEKMATAWYGAITPEPSSAILAGFGSIGLMFRRRRNEQRQR